MQVIVTADDFGHSAQVNAAIIQAHRRGVLTSASLMVAGNAAKEAVQLAQETPTLAVGLHLVVAAGQATLPVSDIPHLVDGNGCFPDDPLRAGLRYFFSHRAQEELVREIAAQFDCFAATGLPLSHVDGHLHMHLHPTVLWLLLPLAVKHGAQGLRVPRDDLGLALKSDRDWVGTKAAWAAVFGLLGRHCLNKLQDRGLKVTDRVYGLMQTGCMEEAYVLQLLCRPQVTKAELFFIHPSRPAVLA